MSDLQRILVAANTGLLPWEQVPQGEWARIAALCGPAEVAELQERITNFQAELESLEEWDGDTQDDINKAIYFFRMLVFLASG